MSFLDYFFGSGTSSECTVSWLRSELPTPLGETSRPDLAPTMLTWILEGWRVAGTPRRARSRLVQFKRPSVRRVVPEDRLDGLYFRRRPSVSRAPLPPLAGWRVLAP